MKAHKDFSVRQSIYILLVVAAVTGVVSPCVVFARDPVETLTGSSEGDPTDGLDFHNGGSSPGPLDNDLLDGVENSRSSAGSMKPSKIGYPSSKIGMNNSTIALPCFLTGIYLAKIDEYLDWNSMGGLN